MNWKPVVGYEGLYEVSDEGEVRSLEREWVSGRGLVRTVKPALKAQTLDRYGYPRVTLCREGKKARKHVHKLVLAAFVGPMSEGVVTRHLDHSRNNNRLENLKYGTPKENSADMIANPAYVHPRGMAGKKHSPEAKAKMSATRAGRKMSEAQLLALQRRSRDEKGRFIS